MNRRVETAASVISKPHRHRKMLFAVWIAIASPALSQSPPPPLLSPQAAYDQAITPVEITHRSILNWSEVEISALGTAVTQARKACNDRAAITYTGDDLIGYARLCAFGQAWPATETAATAYIKSTDPAKPQLTQAYAYLIQAQLNLNEEHAALATSIEMLRTVPYTPLTDEIITASIRYLQLAFPSDARSLQNVRQPILLQLLSSSQTPPQPPAPAPVPPHTLFEHALTYAALEQYDNEPRLAFGIVKDIDDALPATLPPDETIPIDAARRQYALLGTRLPAITVSAALSLPSANPRINPDFGSATVLLLFPPWCAQCIRMTEAIVPTLQRLHEDSVHIYGLLADEPPPPPAPKPPSAAHPHHSTPSQSEAPAPAKADPAPSAADQLRGTPTLVVAPSTLTDFAADDFPFIIATDHNGIIRLLLPAAPDNTFQDGGPIDQIAAHIARQWPVPAAK